MDQHQDTKFMHRALLLAEMGNGNVSPNPMVGCVIVCDNKIIGEGYHKSYGGPHAEVNAIHQVTEQDLLRNSTVYVTLEPCSHQGKTPPCSDLLIAKKVKRVVIATTDPNPLVNGMGIAKLKAAGIEIEVGVLEKEANQLNVRFNTFFRAERPYIILKWAQTSDGFIARKDFSSKWISNALSRQWVHKWRAEEDAVLVGKNTAFYDDPKLNVRDWEGSDPLRIVIDRNCSLPDKLQMFQDGRKTLIYNQQTTKKSGNVEWIKLSGSTFLKELLSDLYSRKIQSLIVEGGSQIIQAFIKEDLWDEARVFDCDSIFGEGIAAPRLNKKPQDETKILEDRLFIYKND